MPHRLQTRRLFTTFRPIYNFSNPHLPSPRSTIGFIGLGAMGKEMAANLLSKTFPTSESQPNSSTTKARAFLIHDHCQQASLSMTEFYDRHAHLHSMGTIIPASTPASVARQASTVITMLPASAAVREVYLNPETGILAGLQSRSSSSSDYDSLCVDCTTLDRADGIEVAAEVSQHSRASMLDAPVSGGVIGAREGTLSFMCGGDRAAFEAAEPFLSRMGRRSVYCGPSGAGLSAKIANNLLLAISMIGTAEAFLLGVKLGLAPELLAQIINTSTGRCWSSEVNNPAPGALLKSVGKCTPADAEYRTGFKSSLMAKDLSLAITAASQNGLSLPLTTLSNRIYDKLGNDPEFGALDFSVIYKWLKIANEGLHSPNPDDAAQSK
ncbi:hypothetical protein CROQUDRAFT_110535 [Cronartium quercuum f. sp. fusiforme G11]|uniref:3-hydroxyisobutyrate dehydrogenase n=1 Tax=Cronartium quercuum f. sp. fusiforme G11 TaxID=708437 RepID=A0A9P6T8C2_9BASI|nr:hypothetical protein CROQUDRAFT_110535 [Cronartium quercuum f. sp. fusiforme G11]